MMHADIDIAEAIRHVLDESLLRIVYQPIVSLASGQVIGYEALTRTPPDSPWRSPSELFQAAAQTGLRQRLECHVRALAVQGFTWGERLPLLFLNYHPSAHCVPSFWCPLGPALQMTCPVARVMAERPQQLVVEFPEEDLVHTGAHIEDAVAALCRIGVAVGLDDFGSGFAGLQPLVRLQPQWLKLDRFIVAGVDTDSWRQAVVRQIAGLEKTLAVTVVAEGIETAAEAAMIAKLGVSMGQGFFLGRPAPHPSSVPPQTPHRDRR